MYRANDGSLHYSEESARQANSNAAGAAMGSLFIVILLFFVWLIPRVVGVVAGFILGLCFKLGIVGKVLTTAIVSAFGFLLFAIFAQPLYTSNNMAVEIPVFIVNVAVFVGIVIWWWGHYEKIRDNSIPYTVMVIKKCACITFYGCIGLAILLGLLSMKFTIPVEIGVIIAFMVPFAFAFFFYYLPDMTNPQIEDCDEEGEAEEAEE
jgi:type III secretory pathway component EscS